MGMLNLPPQIANLFGTLFNNMSRKLGGEGVFDSSPVRSFQQTADAGFQFVAESVGSARQKKATVKAKSAPLAKPASVRKKPTLLASLADEGGIARPSLLGQ